MNINMNANTYNNRNINQNRDQNIDYSNMNTNILANNSTIKSINTTKNNPYSDHKYQQSIQHNRNIYNTNNNNNDNNINKKIV